MRELLVFSVATFTMAAIHTKVAAAAGDYTTLHTSALFVDLLQLHQQTFGNVRAVWRSFVVQQMNQCSSLGHQPNTQPFNSSDNS